MSSAYGRQLWWPEDVGRYIENSSQQRPEANKHVVAHHQAKEKGHRLLVCFKPKEFEKAEFN